MNYVICPKCTSQIPVAPGMRVVCCNCGADYGHRIGLVELAERLSRVANSMAEFCPRCGYPLEYAQDPARLCDTCGWFGDWQEVLHTPPSGDAFNSARAAAQVLELYRDICRRELIIEQAYYAGGITEDVVRKAKTQCRQCAHLLIEMFTALRRVPKIRLECANGMTPWPDAWTDYRYNACNEPCDMLVGPCACGATHLPTEKWVQEKLTAHNAEIVE